MFVPHCIYQWLKRKKYEKDINLEDNNKKRLLLHYTSNFREDKESELATLTIVSHVLEKGITMPSRRMGFGYERVRDIITRCKDIITKYGYENIELQSALADLKQYYDVHKEANFELPVDIREKIEELLQYMRLTGDNCWNTTKEEYFKITTNFAEFAESRHSVRWFSDEPVDDARLMAAITLAQTAPSACNRQATRLKIISSPEGKKLCCELQNGNRGFGDKADKWLLITSELGAWSHKYQYAPYVDAGIYTMNLLYALHYYGIVACTLNAHLTIEQRKKLQDFVGYSRSEVPVVFIVIGNPADKFMVPKSRRLKIDEIIQKA